MKLEEWITKNTGFYKENGKWFTDEGLELDSEADPVQSLRNLVTTAQTEAVEAFAAELKAELKAQAIGAPAPSGVVYAAVLVDDIDRLLAERKEGMK